MKRRGFGWRGWLQRVTESLLTLGVVVVEVVTVFVAGVGNCFDFLLHSCEDFYQLNHWSWHSNR